METGVSSCLHTGVAIPGSPQKLLDGFPMREEHHLPTLDTLHRVWGWSPQVPEGSWGGVSLLVQATLIHCEIFIWTLQSWTVSPVRGSYLALGVVYPSLL